MPQAKGLPILSKEPKTVGLSTKCGSKARSVTNKHPAGSNRSASGELLPVLASGCNPPAPRPPGVGICSSRLLERIFLHQHFSGK